MSKEQISKMLDTFLNGGEQSEEAAKEIFHDYLKDKMASILHQNTNTSSELDNDNNKD